MKALNITPASSTKLRMLARDAEVDRDFDTLPTETGGGITGESPLNHCNGEFCNSLKWNFLLSSLTHTDISGVRLF